MKERDNIEELIANNIEALNDNEPMEGHFARFEAKLNVEHKKSRRFNFSLVWKVAAAVVFVLLASNQAFIYFTDGNSGLFGGTNNNAPVTLASISSEYQEVEYYYTSSINTGIEQWNKWKEQGLISDEEQNMMNEELTEFEGLYENLQKDLAANPNDERVIKAMLDYYQAKLSVITIIINKLEEVQQTSNNQSSETMVL